MSRLAFAGLLGLVVLVPLPLAADRPLPWSVMALWIGVLMALWALSPARRHAAPGPTADRYLLPVVALFALAVGWLVLQTVLPLPSLAPAAVPRAAALLDQAPPAGLGLDQDAAWTTLMRILAYGGVAFLGWQYGQQRTRAQGLVWTVLAATLLYAAYGLAVQLAGLDTVLWFAKTAYRESVTGPFINRNSFATYVGIGLAAALGLAARSWLRRPAGQQRWDRRTASGDPRLALLLLAIVLLGVTLVMTRSRGGFYSFGLAVLAGGVGLSASGALRGRRLALAIGGAAAALVVVLAAGGSGLATRFETDRMSVEAARGRLFAPTVAAIGGRPLTGYGLGSFQGVFEAANDGTLYRQGYYLDKAHNTYLELALEGGIPAAAALTACVAALAAPCLLALWRRRSLAFGLTGTVAAIGVGVHALFDFSLQMPAVAVSFLALLGACAAQSRRSLGAAPQR